VSTGSAAKRARSAPSGVNAGEPTRCVALLRGINVGGNNIIKMADLRAAFEASGFVDVATYIQSGNVVFTSGPRSRLGATVDPASTVETIERQLSSTFGYVSKVAVLTAKHFAEVVDDAPVGFGSEPEIRRYDVLFVLPSMTATEVFSQLSPKAGIDESHCGRHAVYFSRLIERASASQLSRIVSSPVYPHVTIRNWKTTTKLLGLLGQSG
jgi:uncharacterized protein (DUF1697 family)